MGCDGKRALPKRLQTFPFRRRSNASASDAGAQPMVSASSGFAASCNGGFHNAPELTATEAWGTRFRGCSETKAALDARAARVPPPGG